MRGTFDSNKNEVYPFETEFKQEPQNDKITKKFDNPLKDIKLKNLKGENESLLWIIRCLIFCIVFNLILFNIGIVCGGSLYLVLILVIINKVKFTHSDEIDYYLYNISVLSKKIIFKNKSIKKLYDNSNTLLRLSILISFINQLILVPFSSMSFLSGFVDFLNPYGILICILFCFIKKDNKSIYNNMKLFYIFQMIILVKEGCLNYFINCDTYINYGNMLSTLILLFISLYLMGCNLDFKENIN